MTTYIFSGKLEDVEYTNQLLQQILDDYNSKVLVDCSPIGIYAARYLSHSFYRNGILYHVGDQPRINICNFPTIGGFWSEKEMISQMQRDSKI